MSCSWYIHTSMEKVNPPACIMQGPPSFHFLFCSVRYGLIIAGPGSRRGQYSCKLVSSIEFIRFQLALEDQAMTAAITLYWARSLLAIISSLLHHHHHHHHRLLLLHLLPTKGGLNSSACGCRCSCGYAVAMLLNAVGRLIYSQVEKCMQY
ncbi:hypothetical protein, variant [Exophiala dermatitidis NIH/UT8656]|uniref:Uncharacterized protein n=1 Tax=Exophiala dermatitidis (strain ATCC 34100 / CBS 525.76 / NIH/UT8656) TaxID=858893 RepID=H6C632_EXODN|nr:uncharacterized protein HMPREF1120_07175 [Exophiala dermatitidis NIH/UT8656]XP_009159639.1 hypothetical protein, variant [Exophiala dermatitidis NIH/UT8656]EHY59177.1 hypothetical protein, variant [Exophiala dermatitidis NIH/UT8656]EHY59178.1 hypothetical protein HMPREF1120_07175 [Exophiala dermatitidis NIH/UT8656]